MNYNKADRLAIKGLSFAQGQIFSALERIEQGEFVAVPELCRTVKSGPTFVAFSCLAGRSEKQSLGEDSGALFGSRLRSQTEQVMKTLRENGYDFSLKVIIDDCEPRRVWQWTTPQSELTEWCRLVVGSVDIPQGWEVVLWSDVEADTVTTFESCLLEMATPAHALSVHKHLEHMRKFPNKKLTGDIKEAALRRVANYALQGVVFEQKFPQAILFQSETPWKVKDPLYSPLRQSALPIVHPFAEERR